jgi:hypothetical protein
MGASGLMEQGCSPAMGSCCMLSVRRRVWNTVEDEDILENINIGNHDEHLPDHLTQPQPVYRSMMTKPIRIYII